MSGHDANRVAFEFDLASFRRYLQALGRVDSTVREYIGAVHRFHECMSRDGEFIYPGDIRPDHVRRFIAYLLESRSRASANHHAYAMRSFFKFLVLEAVIDRSPAEDVLAPRLRSEPAKILDPSELTAMLRECRGVGFADRRDLAMLRVFVSTGARRFEVVNLKINPLDYGDGDLDLDRGTVRFIGKTGLGRSSPLDSDTVHAIEGYLRMRMGHPQNALPNLWLTRLGGISKTGIHGIMKRRAKAAGLNGFHLYRIRHTFAHEWLKAGGNEGDLMRVMGWKSREMVDRYAAGVAEERAIGAARRNAMTIGL